MIYFPGRFFGFCFLNGSGGNALLGTERIAFAALRNRLNASGPSFISAVWGFMHFSLPKKECAVIA